MRGGLARAVSRPVDREPRAESLRVRRVQVRGPEVVLAGDVFYEKPLADRLLPWFRNLKGRGADILVGDPGRAYLPREGLERLAVYAVPVTRALEDAEVKRTTVWRFT